MSVASRVGFITDIPTPYRDPLLARLWRRPELDLDITYCSPGFAGHRWRLPEFEMPARVLHPRGITTRGKTILTHLVQPEIISLVRRNDYDLLVVSSYAQPTSVMAILTAMASGVPVMLVCESHGRKSRSLARRLLREPYLRWLLPRLAGAFAVGTLARDHLMSYGLPAERIFMFPNTPDVEEFERQSEMWRPHRLATRARNGATAETPVALYVGRLLQVKGVDTLIESWAQVRNRLPGAQLWIAGDGGERRALQAQAARTGGGVRFLGYQQQRDLPALYAAADVFVLPSRDEPWGVVVAEAAASGLPVVASDRVGAARDLVQPGRTGGVFEVDDEAGLARALLSILELPDRGRAQGDAGRELARSWGYELAESEFLRGVHVGPSGRARR